MKILNHKTKHHSYSMFNKVGNGNFGEAYLVESMLDHKRYIMKVNVKSFRESPFKIEERSPKSRFLNRSN